MVSPATGPRIPEYLADPFVFADGGSFYVLGTGSAEAHADTGPPGARVFPLYASSDLETFSSEGGALLRPASTLGDSFWAPEIAFAAGIYYLYYSVGFGDRSHQLRVATSRTVTGPYGDAGQLTRGSHRFAIDPHPFRDEDGRWYLFYATDFLDDQDERGRLVRPGTALVVQELESMLRLGTERTTVLRARFDWQRFLAGRERYGGIFDWHTLEGPCVVRHDGLYYCFYSGGRWDSSSYGIDYAVASRVLGPYDDGGAERGARVLATIPDKLLGPGHNSVVRGPDGSELIAYHAWDQAMNARQFRLSALEWTREGPRARAL